MKSSSSLISKNGIGGKGCWKQFVLPDAFLEEDPF